jgi:hypothetical protein
MSKGEYIVVEKGEIKEYDDFNNIPEDIDNIIKFLPEIPEGPHTHEEHELIDSFNDVFQEKMNKLRKKWQAHQ